MRVHVVDEFHDLRAYVAAMVPRYVRVLAAASAALLVGCEQAPAPPASAPSTVSSSATVEATSAPSPTAIGKTDILVVSFISPGDGTDHAARDRLEAMLKSAAKVPPFVSHHWGKEGEHDECFDLSSFSANERQAFVFRIEEAVRSSKKVTIAENGTCHEGR